MRPYTTYKVFDGIMTVRDCDASPHEMTEATTRYRFAVFAITGVHTAWHHQSIEPNDLAYIVVVGRGITGIRNETLETDC